jgi:putative spermidine/putrescine transport system permease protein
MIDNSFRQMDRNTFLLADTYSLANYRSMWSYSVFQVVLLRSITSSALVTAITVLLAFPYAYVMVRTPSRMLRRVLLFTLFVPFFIGAVVRAYSWIIVLGRYGLINDVIAFLGYDPVKILYTAPAVVIGLVQYNFPFAVLMIAPALTSIPEEIEMAAESLGATWWRAMKEVVLPMAKPGLIAATTVVFTLAFTDYAMPSMMGGGTFDFVSNLVYDVFFGVSDWGLGAALVVVLVLVGSLLVALILLAFDYRRILRRESR